jgi:hypothetical protein
MTRLLSRLRGRGRASDRNAWNGNGHTRRPGSASHSASPSRHVVTAAESAPCTCPDFCERDHEND